MSTPSRTSKSSSTKRNPNGNLFVKTRPSPNEGPPVPMPDVGRTLSYAELRVLRAKPALVSTVPTLHDFAVFAKLMGRNTYYTRDEYERPITHFTTHQFVTALEEENLLSASEKAIVVRVITWLHRLL